MLTSKKVFGLLLITVMVFFSHHVRAQTMLQMPAHSSVFSGSVRGYWFTAPVDFVITGLRVPSQAGSGLQYMQVIKINDATPVVFATTSTNFTSLAYINGAPNGVIQTVNIPVSAGDKIGVFGTAGTSNSYGNATSVSANIAGNSVTLARILHQGSITSSGIPNYSTEPSSSSISRVELYYTTCSTQVTQQPVDKTICENQQAVFSITAQDVTSYKWQVDEGSGYVDVANNTNYAGANTSSLTVKNAPFAFNGYHYRCLASKGTSASCADTSDEVVLTVNGLVKLDKLPAKDTTCVNATKDLEVKGSGSITGYKWQIFITGQGYIDVPNQAPFVHLGNKLQIVGVPDTMDGTRFRCLVDGVCDAATSTELLLTVSLIPTVAVPPADVNTTQGNNAIFEVQASATGARYQWQVAAPDTFVNINDGGIYSGVKTSKLTVLGVSRVQNGYKFRCIVRSGPQCNAPGDISDFGTLYVEPPASVGGLDNNDMIVLYPNPTGTNELFIRTNPNLNGQELKYKVTDKMGRTVMVGNMSGTDKTMVDVARLSADMYLIQIVDANNNTIAKSRFTKL